MKSSLTKKWNRVSRLIGTRYSPFLEFSILCTFWGLKIFRTAFSTWDIEQKLAKVRWILAIFLSLIITRQNHRYPPTSITFQVIMRDSTSVEWLVFWNNEIIRRTFASSRKNSNNIIAKKIVTTLEREITSVDEGKHDPPRDVVSGPTLTATCRSLRMAWLFPVPQ